MPPTLVSEGSPEGFLGSSGWGKLPSSPLLLLQSGVWEGLSHLPLLISLASLLCPQDPWSLDGALEGGKVAWEFSSLPGPSGPGSDPLLLSHSSWRVPPTCLS